MELVQRQTHSDKLAKFRNKSAHTQLIFDKTFKSKKGESSISSLVGVWKNEYPEAKDWNWTFLHLIYKTQHKSNWRYIPETLCYKITMRQYKEKASQHWSLQSVHIHDSKGVRRRVTHKINSWDCAERQSCKAPIQQSSAHSKILSLSSSCDLGSMASESIMQGVKGGSN